VRMLLDSAFTNARENVLAFGCSGSAKTHLLFPVAQELVRSGRKVLFSPCSLLVQDLLIAKRDLKLSRYLRRLSSFEVLIIDDLDYVQQGRQEIDVLFTLLPERYERHSVMITSNLPFSKWENIFKEPMKTVVVINRSAYHSVILELNVPSYRLKQAKQVPQPKA
jgi:DNA replication protein DnaC